MLYKKIGEKIRYRRILKQMTQAELSAAADISLSFLGHIERGTRKLSVETLYAISTVLGCSVDELMETGRYGGAAQSEVRSLLKQALNALGE